MAVVSWQAFAMTFSLVFVLLRTWLFSDFVVVIGLLMLAWIVAELITKGFVNSAPRKFVDPKNKAVLVTGCDSGFGWELAKRLDQLGFHVYAGCLLPDKEGAKSLVSSCSDKLRVLPLDVTKDDQIKLAAKEVGATLEGRELFAVVNNAGVAIFTEVEWCPVDVYRRMFDVNALGPLRVTKAFLPLLRESHGRVIIVASLAGRYTFPGFTAYSMSKHAAVSFADGLRREMKKWDISVHTVEPTLYKTPISSENVLRKNLENAWDSTPSDIKETYGREYFYAFQERMTKMSQNAKKNIEEVVEDLVDSVAGQKPKTRYVPSTAVQIRSRLLSSFPTEVQDFILCKTQPQCLPAAAEMAKKEAAEATRKSGDPLAMLRSRLRRSHSEPPGAKLTGAAGGT